MSKLPYFPCYARDVISSSKIATMSGDAFKAYWLLLCASWLEDERATLPNDEAKLEALARVGASTWLEIKDEVMACFENTENGRLFNPRLLEVSLLQEKRRGAGSKGGSKTQAGDEATWKQNLKQPSKHQSQNPESEIELNKKEEKTPQEVAVIFHEFCPNLPKVQRITQTRIRHIKARNREYPDLDWREYFEKVAASDFLMGRSEEKWSAKFDWLINPANFIKVLEGNYENRESTNPMSVFRD